MLWQPERLINIGIQSLKNTVDQVAWFDPTIIFEDMSWYKKTQTALDSNIICQLFSDVNDEKDICLRQKNRHMISDKQI